VGLVARLPAGDTTSVSGGQLTVEVVRVVVRQVDDIPRLGWRDLGTEPVRAAAPPRRDGRPATIRI